MTSPEKCTHQLLLKVSQKRFPLHGPGSPLGGGERIVSNKKISKEYLLHIYVQNKFFPYGLMHAARQECIEVCV